MAGFCVAGFPVQPNTPRPPAPTPTPATIVGLGAYISEISPNPVTLPTIGGGPPGMNPCQVGDILIASMVAWQSSASMAGHLPSGWILIREDVNAGLLTNRHPLYTGIAYKVATLFDTIPNSNAYVFTNPQSIYLGVALGCVTNSGGVGASSYTSTPSGLTMTVAGTTTTQAGELVLLIAAAGTNSGANYINAGTDGSNVNASDLPLASHNGNTDSANRIFYLNAGAAGTSPSHPVISPDAASSPADPLSCYMLAMLGV